jgi:hypothetical protein
MTAQAIPVAIEEPLCTFQIRADARHTADILVKLTTTVSKNAKCLMDCIDEIHALRYQLEQQDSRHRKLEEKLSEEKEALQLELHQLRTQIDHVQVNCAWRSEVDAAHNSLMNQVVRANAFIDEIENGTGARVQHFVKSYVDVALPRWYDTVSGPMWANIESKFSDVRSEAARKLEHRVGEAEEKARTLVTTNRNQITEHTLQLIEERKRELNKLRELTEDRFVAVNARVDETNLKWPIAVEELREAHAHRMTQAEYRSQALHRVLCIDEQMCDELMEVCGGIPECKSHLSLLEAQQDPRVMRMQRTPHFLNLRTTMQREVNDRIELMKAEVHQDFAAEILDMQRELKGKVTSSKMPELLEMNKDVALYNNVRHLLSEVLELRRNKLDNGQFYDALRSKADVKVLESKIDRVTMNQSMTSVNSRMDELDLAVSRAVERLTEVELHGRDLEFLVKTGKPPDRNFPTTKTIAELLEENVKRTVDAIHFGEEHPSNNGPLIVAGEDTREAHAVHKQLVPVKPSSAGKHGTGNADEAAVTSSGAAPGKTAPRCGSGRPGAQPIRGLPNRAQSARSSIAKASDIGPLDLGPTLIPLTAGQRAYCEAIDLEDASIQRLRSAGTRPAPAPNSAAAARGRVKDRGTGEKDSKPVRGSSYSEWEVAPGYGDGLEEQEIDVIMPELKDSTQTANLHVDDGGSISQDPGAGSNSLAPFPSMVSAPDPE